MEYLASKDMLDGPQGYELLRMRHFQSHAQLNQFCVDRATKGLQRYMPVVQICDDGVVSYLPGRYFYCFSVAYNGYR